MSQEEVRQDSQKNLPQAASTSLEEKSVQMWIFYEKFEHFALRIDAKGVNKSRGKITAIKPFLENVTPGIPDITFLYAYIFHPSEFFQCDLILQILKGHWWIYILLLFQIEIQH